MPPTTLPNTHSFSLSILSNTSSSILLLPNLTLPLLLAVQGPEGAPAYTSGLPAATTVLVASALLQLGLPRILPGEPGLVGDSTVVTSGFPCSHTCFQAGKEHLGDRKGRRSLSPSPLLLSLAELGPHATWLEQGRNSSEAHPTPRGSSVKQQQQAEVEGRNGRIFKEPKFPL